MSQFTLTPINEVLAECNEALQRKWCDPRSACMYAISAFDTYFSSKVKELESKWYIVNDRLNSIINSRIKDWNTQTAPVMKKGRSAIQSMKQINMELQQLDESLKKSKNNIVKHHQIIKIMKLRLVELELCKSRLSTAKNATEETFEQARNQYELVKSVWLPIRNMQLFLAKLYFISWCASSLAQGLRLSLYTVALFITVILDKYTTFIDFTMRQLHTSNYHTITILLIFLIQVFLIDFSVTPFISAVYLKLLRWIITTFKNIIEEINTIEKKVCDAEMIVEELAVID